VRWEDLSVIGLRTIHKDLSLKCCKKRCTQQLTEVHSMHVLISVCSLTDDNLITSKPTWKMKTRKPYSRLFWIILPNNIKTDPYKFELYRFKIGSFLRHSVHNICTLQTYLRKWLHSTFSRLLQHWQQIQTVQYQNLVFCHCPSMEPAPLWYHQTVQSVHEGCFLHTVTITHTRITHCTAQNALSTNKTK